MKKTGLGVVALGMLMVSIACGRETPNAPTAIGDNSSAITSGATMETMGIGATVTLQPDLTAYPANVTVREWEAVKFVNQSGRFVTIRSYNCTEFNLLRIPDAYSLDTSFFRPAGKTCDYFAWDVNWSRKIFVGQVLVQP